MSLREVKEGSFIFEKNNALPDFLCRDMIKRFEENTNDQNRGRVGEQASENDLLKKTTDIYISNKQHWKDVDNNLFRSFALALKEFQQLYPYFGEISRFQDMGYNLQRYQQGEYYHWHVDGDSPELAPRQLVALWYLNNVTESEGETEFLYQGVKVTPQEGKLVLFPPFWTHEHRACTIQKGVKYIATTWLTFR